RHGQRRDFFPLTASSPFPRTTGPTTTTSRGDASLSNFSPHNDSIRLRLCRPRTLLQPRVGGCGRSPALLTAPRPMHAPACTTSAAPDPSCGSPPAAPAGRRDRLRLWSAPRLAWPTLPSAPWHPRRGGPFATGCEARRGPNRRHAATAGDAGQPAAVPLSRGSACYLARPTHNAARAHAVRPETRRNAQIRHRPPPSHRATPRGCGPARPSRSATAPGTTRPQARAFAGGVPCPAPILVANTTADPPSSGLSLSRKPRPRPLGSSRLCPDDRTPAGPRRRSRLRHCAGTELYTHRVTSAADNMELLRGLGRFFHYAEFDLVVCTGCGLTRFF